MSDLSESIAAPEGLPRLIDINRASFELGIGRTNLYALIGAGKLRTVKIGKRRFVPRDALEAFAAGLSDGRLK